MIEDEVKMARAIRRGLEQDGYVVDVATDGNAGLQAGLERDVDAVILDLMLPGLDGLSVCRSLRAHGRWMPVLMLTARDDVGDRVLGLDAGGDDYLVKPFAFDELLARLRALNRRDPVPRPAALAVDDLVLDPASRTVSRSGRPVSLSTKEFALLEFLMRSPGTVLSRDRILQHVWDYDFTKRSNIVDVYVGYLRRKLERPFDRPLIRTVRGVGYTLETT